MNIKSLFSIFFLAVLVMACRSTGQIVGVTSQSKTMNKKISKFLKEYKGYTWVPAGTKINLNTADNQSDTVSFPGFIMFKTEIANIGYMEFISYIKRKFGNDSAKALLPDTTVWNSEFGINEPLTKLYFRHPVYRNYPVVGVSHYQAEIYCNWLTEIFAMKTDLPFRKVSFSLPTEAEWEFAARGGLELSPYPWGGPYTRNSKGLFLANFLRVMQGSVYRDSLGTLQVNRNEWNMLGNQNITAPVNAYYPNGYGLYNMAGNVEEMVKEEGIAKGGSWKDPGYYLQISVRNYYKKETVDSKRGFRIVMHIEE